MVSEDTINGIEDLTLEYVNSEASKTILIEGYSASFSVRDPSIITVSFYSMPSSKKAVIFSEVAFTIKRAQDFVSDLTKTIERCLSTEESTTDSKT